MKLFKLKTNVLRAIFASGKYRPNKLKSYKLQANSGFTIIEALVAVTILAVSVMGPLTIATKGLSAALFAQDQITAFYLAQEAIEYVRNTRDGNLLGKVSDTNIDWLDGKLFFDCMGSDGCTIDVWKTDSAKCTGNCSALLYNNTSGFYHHDDMTGDASTNFIRSVYIETKNDDEITVTATVSWSTGVLKHSFSVKENMFNWF